jgi:hypothetical protein
MPGIGKITALTLRAAVDLPERCRRSRAVGAHPGLTPALPIGRDRPPGQGPVRPESLMVRMAEERLEATGWRRSMDIASNIAKAKLGAAPLMGERMLSLRTAKRACSSSWPGLPSIDPTRPRRCTPAWKPRLTGNWIAPMPRTPARSGSASSIRPASVPSGLSWRSICIWSQPRDDGVSV